jgi:hypothetical protein
MKTRVHPDAEFWKDHTRDLKQDLSDFARPKGATTDERLRHRWAKLCERDAEGKRCYKAYTLTPRQTAGVEFMLYGLEKMANLAVEQAHEIERLKEEMATGPQGTVDRLIDYLDPDSGTRRR